MHLHVPQFRLRPYPYDQYRMPAGLIKGLKDAETEFLDEMGELIGDMLLKRNGEEYIRLLVKRAYIQCMGDQKRMLVLMQRKDLGKKFSKGVILKYYDDIQREVTMEGME